MINLNGHKPIIISTAISLLSILGMAFYLGAKTENLQAVRDNQIAVSIKLDAIIAGQARRDVDMQELRDKIQYLRDDFNDFKIIVRKK